MVVVNLATDFTPGHLVCERYIRAHTNRADHSPVRQRYTPSVDKLERPRPDGPDMLRGVAKAGPTAITEVSAEETLWDQHVFCQK